MQNSEHITEENFNAYAMRELVAAETLAVQKHIAECDACRRKLAQIVGEEKAFAAIRNDFGFDDAADAPEHLPFKQLAFFVDGKLDDVEREIAESHFAICPECAKDLIDLQQYRAIAAAPMLPKKSAEARTKSFWQKLLSFDSIGSFAPVTAAILLAVLMGAWFLLRSNQTNEIAQANVNKIAASPSPIANDTAPNTNNQNAGLQTNSNADSVNAGGNQSPKQPENVPSQSPELAFSDGQITVNQNGDVRGLENLSPQAQKAIRQSLQTGKVSNGANSLGGGGGGVLMGGNDETGGVPFALLSPVGKFVRENQPVLRWKQLNDAASYKVTIVDSNFRVVEESGKLNATTWKPSKSLPRGTIYSWQVTATKNDGSETASPAAPAPQAKFKILDQKTADDLTKSEKTKSHLALGVLYANAGMTGEARREFQMLVKENPRSSIARKLLAGVR